MDNENSYLKKILLLRQRMWEASVKAAAASKEYNEIVDALQTNEKESWAAALFDKDTIKLRASVRADTYRPLLSAYNRYKFWTGEVERMSSVLQGEYAYGELYKTYIKKAGMD